ncbi:MAG TPA: FtsX-like permease family protein [Candidatus Limnocylindria bacterium]|nr:FtsX-like permease family protein [Candidatus Limnocylindria bacterium]
MPIPISYNLRNITQRPISTLATAVGIGLVVAVLIGTLALASGFRAALTATGSTENLIVLRKGADSEISSSISRDQANILRAHPAVAQRDGRPLVAAELVVLTNLPRLGQAGSSNVPIRGIETAGLPFRSAVKVVAGRMFSPGSSELIVGKRIASRFANCRIGDRLRFGQREFAVVGHFEADGSAFESEIWGDLSVLGPSFDRDGYQSVTFRMADASRFKTLERELEGDPRLGVDVRTERDWYQSQSQLLSGVIQVAGVFITLIMAIGAIFGAMNTMFAAVSQRRREIAVLLTLGFTPGSVMLSFVIESVVLALIGGVLGCLLALLLNGITTSTTNWQSFSEVAFAFRVTPMALAIGLAFAAMLGLVGGFLPSLRAARQPLAQGMRAL